jgi:GxxExxY protein
MSSKKYVDILSYDVMGAAIEVHKALGPGLLESVYHKCFIKKLTIRKINFTSEFSIPIEYKGEELDANLRCDLYIDKTIIVELKSVEALMPIHEAQVLTYMKLLKSPKGILINFNVQNLFKEGQKTFVNEYFRNLKEE